MSALKEYKPSVVEREHFKICGLHVKVEFLRFSQKDFSQTKISTRITLIFFSLNVWEKSGRVFSSMFINLSQILQKLGAGEERGGGRPWEKIENFSML